MEVILQKSVEKVGAAGEIVDVRPGFARNYLIPQGLAVPATKKRVRHAEHLRRGILSKNRRQMDQVKELAARIESADLTIPVKVGEQGKLFGAVTAKDIQEALKKQGIEVDRRTIGSTEDLKTIGAHNVDVKIHPDVTARAKIWLVGE